MSVKMTEGGIYRRRDGGVTEPIESYENDAYPWKDGKVPYTDAGKSYWEGVGDDGLDPIELIELITPLDNGDGTTTKVCTIPVTMDKEAWETHDVVAVRCPKAGEDYADASENGSVSHSLEGGVIERLILTPKTPAVDPYWIELREWVDAGGSLPPRAEKLEVFDELRGGNHAGYLITRDHDRGRWVNHHWNTRLLGRLPKNNTKKIITIDLAAFRKWHAERGEGGA